MHKHRELAPIVTRLLVSVFESHLVQFVSLVQLLQPTGHSEQLKVFQFS
jgi:hypothetical protein